LPEPYEQLATVLRQAGFEEGATEVEIEKNRDHARHVGLISLEAPWYRWFGPWIGFGYRPWYAFWYSCGMIAFGHFIFKRGRDVGQICPTDRAADSQGEAVGALAGYPRFSPFVFSMEAFVPLMKLYQLDYWRFNSSGSCWRRIYFRIHIIVGWVLTTLWVGGLAGLLKT
jgi:hypothetical protein